MTNKWIKRLEGVQRSYQKRVEDTQHQLKTIRFEQTETNRQIVEMKRATKMQQKEETKSLELIPLSYLIQRSQIDHGDDATPTKKAFTSNNDVEFTTNDTVEQLRMKKHSKERRMSSMVEEIITTWQEEGKHDQPVLALGGTYKNNSNGNQVNTTTKAKKKKKKPVKSKSKSKKSAKEKRRKR